MNLDDMIQPEIARDRWGRYLLPDPHTGEQRPWQRVTTFNKITADTYNLEQWRLDRAAIGFAMRPDLVALIAGVADPASRDGRKTIRDAVAQAIETAGGSAAANLGTALHGLTEQADRGEPVTAPTDELAERIDTYRQTLAAHQLVTRPEWIERVVVNTTFDVAGTTDRFVQCPDGAVRVADLKTGRTVDFGAGEHAMQLAAYAGADGMWNGTGWDPMPDRLDPTVGYIIHLPAQGGPCRVHGVNLDHGTHGGRLAAEVRQWRKAKGVMWELPHPIEQRRLDILRRCQRLDSERRQTMKQLWPDNIPGLNSTHHHTDTELDRIVEILELVDGTRIDETETAKLRDRMEHLPADLAGDVTADAKKAHIPHITRGWSTADAELLTALIDNVAGVADQRHRHRLETIRYLPESDLIQLAAHTGITRDRLGVSTLDNLEHQRIVAVAELHHLFGTFTPDPEIVIDHVGSKRELIAAAKTAANRHGLETARAAADIAADPLLAALAIHTINNNNTGKAVPQ